MLRSLAVSSAKLSEAGKKGAFSLFEAQAVADGGGEMMTIAERHMAVRSLGTMVEFARLGTDPSTSSPIRTEIAMFGQVDPMSVSEQRFKELVARHKEEWQGFMERFPKGGWAQTIVSQL